MKPTHIEGPCSAALTAIGTVLRMYCGRPIIYRHIHFNELNDDSATRRIAYEIKFRTSEQLSRIMTCKGVISMGKFTDSEWNPHAGAQWILIANKPVAFSRESPVTELVDRFKLLTMAGNLVVGSDFHDVEIVHG